MEPNIEYDMIVVGGGPVGASVAIFAKRLGKKVILLEKGATLGPDPRGETLHFDPILDEVLGQGVMERLALSHTEFREYFPPKPTMDAKVELARKTPSIVFDWRQWMDQFTKQITALKIPCVFEAEVYDIIAEDNQVKGVKYRNADNSTKEVKASIVFVCDGHKSIIARIFHAKYRFMNFPIVKSIMKNGNHSSKAFKFFIVPTGALDYAPKFPPFLIFFFPRDKQNVETGIILQTDNAKELGIKIPPVNEIMGIWVKIKNSYPIYSDLIKRASIIYEDITTIPMTGPIPNFNPLSGLYIMGDAAGFVEASGGSGLVASIKMAKFWVNNVEVENDGLKIQSKFKGTDLHKHIAKVAKRYNGFRRFLFVRLKTTTRIRKMWWLIKLILKLA